LDRRFEDIKGIGPNTCAAVIAFMPELGQARPGILNFMASPLDFQHSCFGEDGVMGHSGFVAQRFLSLGST
jgi:hypothetical protein